MLECLVPGWYPLLECLVPGRYPLLDSLVPGWYPLFQMQQPDAWSIHTISWTLSSPCLVFASLLPEQAEDYGATDLHAVLVPRVARQLRTSPRPP